MDIYQVAVRPILFSGLKADPEWLHHQTMKTLQWLDQSRQAKGLRPPTQWLCHQIHQLYSFADPSLNQTLWGLNFPNPVGLAAGFDKNGVASGIWADFGFGFTEVGTVTFHPQPGNPRPRLFRLLEDGAVLNRMGFNNQGAEEMAAVLAGRWGSGVSGVGCRVSGVGTDGGDRGDGGGGEVQVSGVAIQPRNPLGVNLGKSKITPLEAAAEDYLSSFRLLKNLGDYFVVNVSSPNTPGLRSLQATENLEPILSALQQENQQHKPLLVKIAPDLAWDDIAAVIDLARKHNLAGIIATNTTISRDGLKAQTLEATGNSIKDEAGGISGLPLRQRSTEVIRFIYQETQGTLPIIGVGGVFTPEAAWEKITAGASLIQVYTGWVYEGPWMVKRILQGLKQKLEAKGLASISQAVGLKE